MTGTMLTQIMGAMGRGGDSMVGHLTKGDVVIPREIALEHPEFLTKLQKAMEDKGADYRTHVAGSGYENKNPHTGAPEFNWFSSMGKSLFSNPITGQHLFGVNNPGASSTPSAPPIPAPDLGAISQPFTPKQPSAITMPTSLTNMDVNGQQFGTLTPQQQSSYLATQGTSGGGLSGENKDYYMNLLQRNLIDQNGNQQNINNALLPVERNYISSLGLPTGNTGDFLQAVQQPK